MRGPRERHSHARFTLWSRGTVEGALAPIYVCVYRMGVQSPGRRAKELNEHGGVVAPKALRSTGLRGRDRLTVQVGHISHTRYPFWVRPDEN